MSWVLALQLFITFCIAIVSGFFLFKKKETLLKMSKNNKKQPPIDSFLKKIKIIGDDCWVWIGEYSVIAVPVLKKEDNCIRADKFSYEYFKEKKIPFGYYLDHICGNKNCVNPKHLSLEKNNSEGIDFEKELESDNN